MNVLSPSVQLIIDLVQDEIFLNNEKYGVSVPIRQHSNTRSCEYWRSMIFGALSSLGISTRDNNRQLRLSFLSLLTDREITSTVELQANEVLAIAKIANVPETREDLKTLWHSLMTS